MELYTLEWHVDYEGDGVLGIFSSEKEARDVLEGGLDDDDQNTGIVVTINCYKFGKLYDSSASYHNEVARFTWDFEKKKWKEVE